MALETDDTNVTTTPDEPGTNDVVTAGAQTQSAETEAPKTFSQSELDTIIKSRLAEKERTLRSKHEKDLEAQIAAAREEAQKDLDKLIEERVTARLAEQELAKTKASLLEELGLSEEQVARLQGETPEELRADAEKIFGKRPKPPVIKTGSGSGGPESPLDISKMSPAEVRANTDKLWPTVRVP